MQSPLQFSYYPGCSVEGMNKAYDKATRVVCKALDINLAELSDWNCCGATSYMAINEQRAHLLSARNLALAEKEKKDLVVVCPACLTTLTKTNRYMGEDPKLRRTVDAALGAAGMQYQGGAEGQASPRSHCQRSGRSKGQGQREKITEGPNGRTILWMPTDAAFRRNRRQRIPNDARQTALLARGEPGRFSFEDKVLRWNVDDD